MLLLAGAMRFLGTTLMHAAAASIPGIALGLAHYKPRHVKQTAAIAGVILAATLHSTFNIWIVQNNGLDFFTVFTFLWIVTIAVLALFEVLRKMGGDKYVGAKRTNAMGSVSALVANFVSKIGATPLEEKPFTTFLAEKGLAPTAPEYAELAKVIGTLREAYTAYLASEGAPQADAAKVVLAVIPDALSPKAAEGIVAVLVRAAEAPAVAEIAA